MDIFGDESGYSGTNLMNADAPVFIVATCNLSNQESSNLISEFFPGLKTELHFSELKNTHFESLVELIGRLKSLDGRICMSIAHKPFVTLIKMIDCWLDESVELSGRTLYHSKRNFVMANMAYTAMMVELGQTNFFRLLRSFQEMMLGTCDTSYSQFWDRLGVFDCEIGSFSRMFLDDLIRAEKALGGRNHRDCLRNSPIEVMDIGLTTEKMALAYWSHQTIENLNYYHDAASEFAQQKWMWSALTNDKGDKHVYELDGYKFEYPIRIEKTVFVDSKLSPSIQICDVLASAFRESTKQMFGIKCDECVIQTLQALNLHEFLRNAVWPSSNPNDWKEDPSNEAHIALADATARIGRAVRNRQQDELTEGFYQSCLKQLKARNYKAAAICLNTIYKRNNSVISAVILGFLEDKGIYGSSNKLKSNEWFRKAIFEVDLECSYIVALTLMIEHDCEPERFITMMEKSAKDGHLEAAYKLAGLYLNGIEGVFEKDHAKAFEWSKKTASEYVNSMLLLGDCYYHGYGVKANRARAKQSYRRAYEGGSQVAFQNLIAMELNKKIR